ncbi:MAG: hypothetical protein JNK48_17745 [Bryobacterales bacterium]|nr:hypothetical protein [Bryobacterales bacterium]
MIAITLFLAAATLLPAQNQTVEQLAAVRAEREPEKRYWKALELAASAAAAARTKYEAGLLEEFRSSLILTKDAVVLCDETLRGTGKDPAKNPKHFKRAEQKIRDIIRKLSGLHDAVSIDDRAPVRDTRDALQKLQEELVTDIVGRRN